MQCTSTHERATDVLVAEHKVISQVLDCLDALADESAAPAQFQPQAAADIIEFLTQFADRCHHGKEENCLFPAMNARGLPSNVGPIAVMLTEHVEGRDAISRMRAELDGCRKSDAAAIARFKRAARNYTMLLREHISKENEVLFPMADSLLGDAGQKQVLAAFERVETHDMGAGTHEKYLALATDLVKRLGVTPKPMEAQRGGGCCGHHGH